MASKKKINEKMVTKKKSFSILKVLWILITLSLAAVIYSDVKSTGSWQGSSTQKLINSTGVCGYVHKALDKGKEGWLVVDAKIDETFPGYQKKVQDFSAPYVKLFSDIGKLGTNVACNVRDYAVEKYPVVKASIDAYAPGLIESSQTAVGNAWSTSVVYYTRSVDYLKQEVFVGQLSPENMQRVVIEAFNTTSQKATECYHWLYEKVQTNIK